MNGCEDRPAAAAAAARCAAPGRRRGASGAGKAGAVVEGACPAGRRPGVVPAEDAQ